MRIAAGHAHDDPTMATARPQSSADRGREAVHPGEIPPAGWRDVLSRVRRRIADDNLSITAAGSAFYALFATFPGLLSLFGLYALAFDRQQIAEQFAFLEGQLQPHAGRLLVALLEGLATVERPQLGLGIAGGLLVTLWGTSVASRALIRALNVAYGEKEKRSLLARTLVALALAAGVIVAGFGIALVLIGVPVWSRSLAPALQRSMLYARWPVVAAVFWLAMLALYRFGPSRASPKWSWVSWGALLATALWLAGSGVLAWVVGGAPVYQHLYGIVGTLVLVLAWFLLSAYAVLLGAEINGELERQTRHDTTTGPEKPLGTRGAAVADSLGDAAPSPGSSPRQSRSETQA